MTMLEADRLAITFGGVRAIDGVNISIASGQVFSIIGPNGSGKTTLLLLDEPAAGCNPVETQELDQVIRAVVKDGVTVVLVEHDMRLVMNISDRVHVLARGRTLAEGTPQEVRANAEVIEAYLGAHGLREAAHALD